jgi:xylitol oxidase
VVGSAHSFTPLVSAESEGALLLSLRRMPRLCALDGKARTVTVDAGTTLSEVCAFLADTPYALPNTASLPHFSVAGAVATGTHGSSGMGADGRLKRAGLAEAVSALEIVGPQGDVRRIARGDPGFDCSVVSLGLLGVVSLVTIDLVPAYSVRQRVFGGWPPEPRSGSLAALLDSLPDAMAETGSFSAFLNWSVDSAGMLILRDTIPEDTQNEPAPEWCGAALQQEPIEGFLEGFGAFEATSSGPWHDKTHVWMKDARPFGPQAAAELQLEHFVPLTRAAEALERTRLVGEQWGASLLYAEVRAVRGGEQLLCPATCDSAEGSDTIAITHGMCGSLGEARVLQAAGVLEEALAPLRARPHWGKLTSLTPGEIEELYGERLVTFRRHRHEVDPQGKFTNAWLDEMVVGRR